MAKLTDKQRKQIIAEYALGGITQRQLANRYQVSQNAIVKILNSSKGVQEISEKKEENTRSMLEFLDEQKDTAQNLMRAILQTAPEDIQKASLRDKMGALKILSEVFGAVSGPSKDNTVTEIIITPEDASGEDDET